MTIVFFIIILALLILVHELGHFLAARLFNIKVDEFGIGFPPKIATLFKWKETEFTINSIPFGGFVKILGENPEEEVPDEEKSRSFNYANRGVQAIVLVAGVVFNLLFAWILISIILMMGAPATESAYGERVKDSQVTVIGVMQDSPAEKADVKSGDVILGIEVEEEVFYVENVEDVPAVISSREGEELNLLIKRADQELSISVTPELIEENTAVGVALEKVGLVSFSPPRALWEGMSRTVYLTGAIAVGLTTFLAQAIAGSADLSQVAGPVGIVGLVGDASAMGFVHLIQFTAFISINLALINLLPFPALDGGRLLFVAIESVKRTPINPKIAGTLNGIGFILLIILMIVITYNDIFRLLN